jgi:hypothetical protein
LRFVILYQRVVSDVIEAPNIQAAAAMAAAAVRSLPPAMEAKVLSIHEEINNLPKH